MTRLTGVISKFVLIPRGAITTARSWRPAGAATAAGWTSASCGSTVAALAPVEGQTNAAAKRSALAPGTWDFIVEPPFFSQPCRGAGPARGDTFAASASM